MTKLSLSYRKRSCLLLRLKVNEAMTKRLIRISREVVHKLFVTGTAFRIKVGIDKDDKLLSWTYDIHKDEFALLFGKEGDPELIVADDFFPILEWIP